MENRVTDVRYVVVINYSVDNESALYPLEKKANDEENYPHEYAKVPRGSG